MKHLVPDLQQTRVSSFQLLSTRSRSKSLHANNNNSVLFSSPVEFAKIRGWWSGQSSLGIVAAHSRVHTVGWFGRNSNKMNVAWKWRRKSLVWTSYVKLCWGGNFENFWEEKKLVYPIFWGRFLDSSFELSWIFQRFPLFKECVCRMIIYLSRLGVILFIHL